MLLAVPRVALHGQTWWVKEWPSVRPWECFVAKRGEYSAGLWPFDTPSIYLSICTRSPWASSQPLLAHVCTEGGWQKGGSPKGGHFALCRLFCSCRRMDSSFDKWAAPWEGKGRNWFNTIAYGEFAHIARWREAKQAGSRPATEIAPKLSPWSCWTLLHLPKMPCLSALVSLLHLLLQLLRPREIFDIDSVCVNKL